MWSYNFNGMNSKNDYLEHKNFKYISKKMGKNGKYRYIYESDDGKYEKDTPGRYGVYTSDSIRGRNGAGRIKKYTLEKSNHVFSKEAARDYNLVNEKGQIRYTTKSTRYDEGILETTYRSITKSCSKQINNAKKWIGNIFKKK